MKTLALTASAMALVAAPALADVTATAVTDLNVRAGPGPQHAVRTVIDGGADASLEGCLENSKWCKVSFGGESGWAYGEYLTASMGDNWVPILNDDGMQIDPVTYDNSDASLATGATGAVTGALVGGPVGAAVGGAAGVLAGNELSEAEVAYVRENRVDPVYLDGEVVTGARVPQTVELQSIPDSEYGYAYVNGMPVIVNADDGSIVHVVR